MTAANGTVEEEQKRKRDAETPAPEMVNGDSQTPKKKKKGGKDKNAEVISPNKKAVKLGWLPVHFHFHILGNSRDRESLQTCLANCFTRLEQA